MFDVRMSSDQLVAEYHADLPEIQEQTISFDKSNYVSKYLRRHKREELATITRFFNSSRGNGYLGILVYTKSHNPHQKSKWRFVSFHIGLMNTRKGMCAIAFYAQSRQAIKFTAHFFHRYKERFEKICDKDVRSQLSISESVVDIISVYMKRNLSMTWIETRSVFSNNVHIFAPVNDGVALLQWNRQKKLLQANTFVTMDMLDEKQAEMVDYTIAYASLSEEQKQNYQSPDFISND